MKKIFNFIKTDFFIIFFLLIISAIPRLILLDKIPPGVHGDEGWAGINARLILNDKYIPPAFVPDLQGTPTGSLYLIALTFKIFGDSIFTLRLTMAILGILTIPLYYVFLRYFFDKKTSFLSVLALSLSLIHIYYSRVTFMVIGAQFFQILSLIFFIQFDKNKKQLFLILSAIFSGLGLYSYYVFILFPLTLIVYLLVKVLRAKFSFKEIGNLFIFLIFFLLISIPLLRIIIFQSKFYFDHFKSYSTVNELLIKNGKVTLTGLQAFFSYGINKLRIFFIGNHVDYIDGFGKYYVFNYSYLILAFLGIIISFIKKNYQRFFIFFSFLFFLSPIFLTFEGTYRRSILTLVYFYFFVAISINWILNISKKNHIILFLFLISFVILSESFLNLSIYFNKFSRDEETKSVFFVELTESAILIKNQFSPSDKIYLFSDRNPCTHETLRYLLNKYKCENRSSEFGLFSLKNINRPSIILLIGKYIPLLSEIKNRFKNGQEYLIRDRENNKVLAIIYKI